MQTQRRRKMFRRFVSTARYAWKDIHYTAQCHPKHTLDIAVPKVRDRPKLKTCVFVHGGSWQRGDKAGLFNDGIEDAFARAGYVGVSVNYRLSPEVTHPDHTRDVAAAVSWICRNIEKYGGDASDVVLIGHSAGAHIIMQAVANPVFFKTHGIDHRIVTGVIGLSGVYNVVRLANARFYGPLTVNPAFGERVDQWREGSVTTVLARQGHGSPLYRTPTLLLTAEDDFHFGEDAAELKAWLKDGGNVCVESDVVPDRNHFTIIRDLTVNPEDESMRRIVRFLEDTTNTK